MPFKTKKSKTNIENITVDHKHNELQSLYFKNRKIVAKLDKENAKLSTKIKTQASIDSHLEMKDTIAKNNKRISQLNNLERQYYIDNAKHIFEYFENKKDISKDINKKHMLTNFFNNKEEETIYDVNIVNYFKNTNVIFPNENYVYNEDVCTLCRDGELIEQASDGMRICNQCGNSIKYIVQNNRPSYKDPPKEVCFYAYKRINHFREILAQFQAKESTNIAEHIIENIKKQIEKERMSYDELTNSKTKEILKKLGYNKYYEHISFIKEKLGIKPPVMSIGLEETLCNLFTEIQVPYSKFCPKERVNFLNYYYTIYKFCEMLNYREFLPYFPMLKDRDKIIEQDIIWKKICKELDWKYIPTV
jgi:hypothetical protein